ncbi:hypothetical protein PFISCL1PPCAC_9995 [Pristionchus fissidentatus]|uniref:WH1 domain-containing protein n=1 Tax=Pristionchus fissidentatus TaxID=1538716 RepID=A0AAV5VKA3_9BILA|nr:hypothetical protein PFISCL1PPCAC_9995 [Pristionchus fissidentatus]
MLSAYTVPHRFSSQRTPCRVTVDDTTVDSPLYHRRSVYYVCDRLEIDTEEERSIYENGQYTFLQESNGRNGSIYYPSSLPSFRVPPLEKKRKKKRNREKSRDDEIMSSQLLRAVTSPQRQNLSALLDDSERRRIADLLGRDAEVLSSGIAQLLFSTGSSWDERARGVVCYVKDYTMKTKSIAVIDPAIENTRILDAIKWSSISQVSMSSHKFLITFEVDAEIVMGLNFHSEVEANHFYHVLIEAQQKSDVRRSMRGSKRPKEKPQPSKVSPLSQQSTSSRDSGIVVEEEKPKKKKESKESKSIIALFFGSKKKKKKREEEEGKRSRSNSTFHVPVADSSSSSKVEYNGDSSDRKIDWRSNSPSSSSSSTRPPTTKFEFKPGEGFNDAWNDETESSIPVSSFSSLTINPSTLPVSPSFSHSTPADYGSNSVPLLMTNRSGSLENAAHRSSIRMSKTSTPSTRRTTPKEIKLASDAKRADRHWESPILSSALPSPLPSIDTSPPQMRGPLPAPHRSRSPTPPRRPPHRSRNEDAVAANRSTIYIQSSASPLSPPPSYPPPPPPPTSAPETTVPTVHYRLSGPREAPPPPAPHHQRESTVLPPQSIPTVFPPTSSPPPPPPTLVVAPTVSPPSPPPIPAPTVSSPPPPPPLPPTSIPIVTSTPPSPPPPPPSTTTVSSTRNGAPPINDLLSQIRSVNKDNFLKTVDRTEPSPTTPAPNGGIMESLQKEIEKRRTVMNESSCDEGTVMADCQSIID